MKWTHGVSVEPRIFASEINTDWLMKEWQCLILLGIGVALIILLSYWLTSTLSFWWCNGIVIAVNFIVSVYLILQKKKSSN